MSTRSKGDRREREAKELLEEQDYIVHKKVNNQYDSGDIYGLFDLVAVKPSEKVKFIQVKSNGTGGELGNTMDEAAELLPLEHVEVEFWIAYDYEGWRVLRMREEWMELVDERGKSSAMGEHLLDSYS